MRWFRLYNEFARDPKVQMMSEALQRRLVMLFCVHSDQDIETLPVTERESFLAFQLRISVDEIATTKAAFVRAGFLNEDYTLRNWDKRQADSDDSTQRVRRFREKHKTSETLPKRPSNGPDKTRTEEIRRDKTREEKTRKDNTAAATAADNERQQQADASLFPETAGVVHCQHPGTSPEFVAKLAAAASLEWPGITDSELASVLATTHRGKLQKTAGLWLNTVPDALRAEALRLKSTATNSPPVSPPAAQLTPQQRAEHLQLVLRMKPDDARAAEWQRELDQLSPPSTLPTRKQPGADVQRIDDIRKAK